jgi:hypothetical protein
LDHFRSSVSRARRSRSASSELRRSPAGTTAEIGLSGVSADEEELDRAARPPRGVALSVREARVLGGIVTVRRDRNEVINRCRHRVRRLQVGPDATVAEMTAPSIALTDVLKR